MTDGETAPLELIEKGADADLVREVPGFAAGRPMEAEVQARTGAAHGARDPARRVRRDGRRGRAWETGAGRIGPGIPRPRRGSHFPSFLEPRRAAEKALAAVTQEARIHGVSARAVDDLVEAVGGSGVSRGEVSRLVEGIDGRANAFLTRPLEGEWPHVWIDAAYVKAREGGRIVSAAATIAVGVDTDGRREVLGAAAGASEAEVFRKGFLRSLADRGLRGVEPGVADDHEGPRAAAPEVFHAGLRRRRVHRMRSALAHVPAKQRPAVVAMLKTVLARGTAADARARRDSVAGAPRGRAPEPAGSTDGAREDVPADTASPGEHRPRIAGTSPLERPNGETRRRSDVVGIFPDAAAVVRLVGALMPGRNDGWAVSRRCMSLESPAVLSGAPRVGLPGVAA